jgi:magnesium-transporting ATPase (P-type)|tara:strand:- start:73 stop:318 length:246 start_codon:yes stop_codon:yes gene_type:complete
MAITQSVNAQLNLKTDKYEIVVNTPDEIAFQKCMEEIMYNFETRVVDDITLSLRGKMETFKLIETMPFDPYRKKMSLMVKT